MVQLGRPRGTDPRQSLFSLVVGLLSTVAATNGMARDAGARSVGSALRAADRELTTLSRFVQASARRTALGRYLAGSADRRGHRIRPRRARRAFPTIGAGRREQPPADLPRQRGDGAIINVMARVSQGERVDVDSDKTKMVTVLAGSFLAGDRRVFGAVLYVLICGGSFRWTVPGGDQKRLFFAGLAFVAGFLHGTVGAGHIVSSAPKVK